MTVSTPEDCVKFVESVQICSWRIQPKLPWLRSLEAETPWRDTELTKQTWFWKDDLHIERRLYFGMLIAPAVPVFVSLSLLPCLIAAQGDIDARTLFENGALPRNALAAYEFVERHGPTATNAIPWPTGSRMLYLAHLQQKFLLTKHDLTGRTRATYGHRWSLCEDAFPDAFNVAARVDVIDARKVVLANLNESDANVSPETAARLFRWQSV